MAFTYNNYTESDEVKRKKAEAEAYKTYKEAASVTAARNAMNQHNANKVGAWTGGTYADAVKTAMDKIANRPAFSYDINGDALYQQYKNQYMQGGKLAMQDTLGQAAALTGGYGNSYGVTAANQAYQQYLTGLTDKIPELYSMALSKYEMEGNDLKDQLSMYNNAYNTEYGEYRDRVSDWNTEAARLADAYNQERNFDYGKFTDNRNYYTDAYNNERSYDYGMYTDAYNRAFANYQQQVSEDQWAKDYALQQAQLQASIDSDTNAARVEELEGKYAQAQTYEDLLMRLTGAKIITRGNRGNTGNGGYSYNGNHYKTYNETYAAVTNDIAEAYNNGNITEQQANSLLDLLEKLESNLKK